MSRRLAVLSVDTELLRQALHLPDSVRIDNVFMDINRDCVLLRVEGPDFEPVGEGGVIPKVGATFSKSADGAIEFIGWKL